MRAYDRQGALVLEKVMRAGTRVVAERYALASLTKGQRLNVGWVSVVYVRKEPPAGA